MSVSLILASLLPYSLHQPSSALPRVGPDLTAVGMFAICIEVSAKQCLQLVAQSYVARAGVILAGALVESSFLILYVYYKY